MRQEYKEQLSRKIADNYSELEERIMQDIIRRIQKTGKMTSTAENISMQHALILFPEPLIITVSSGE